MSDVNVVFLSKSQGLCPTPLTKLNKHCYGGRGGGVGAGGELLKVHCLNK